MKTDRASVLLSDTAANVDSLLKKQEDTVKQISALAKTIPIMVDMPRLVEKTLSELQQVHYLVETLTDTTPDKEGDLKKVREIKEMVVGA